MTKAAYLAAALGAVAMLGGCVDRQALTQGKKTQQLLQDKVMPVRVQTVATDTLVDTLDITGEVTTSDESTVAAKLGGRIVAVYVKDGDPVRAGQILATQDTTNYRLQVQQALAEVSAARSTYSQAISNATVGPSRTTAALKGAQAQLRSAQAQLLKAERGSREEDRIQAANNVSAAKSNMVTAKTDVERKRTLFGEGAISKQELDMSENAYQAALSQYENALQAQKVTLNYSRPEDIESAKEAVRQAEEAVRSAEAEKKLDVLLNDQVQSAKANLESAQAELALARQNIADSDIRSLVAGKISGKPVQVGTVVGAGNPVAQVIGGTGAYFEGEVSENAIAKISLGSRVSVKIDALDGRTLPGTVVAINPLGDQVGRIFKARVQIVGDLAGVRPGMFARGSVVLRSYPNVTVVPTEALVERGANDYVFVVEGSKVKLTSVSKGLQKDGVVEVTGVTPGEKIVVSGQTSLDDGTPIRIDESKSDTASTTAGGSAL